MRNILQDYNQEHTEISVPNHQDIAFIKMKKKSEVILSKEMDP